MAYPLAKIDTINEETGDLNENSALNLVVSGDNIEHLEMLDGLLEDLLEAKWASFARRRSIFWKIQTICFSWIYSLLAFILFYGIFSLAFMNRPFSATSWVITQGNISWDGNFVRLTNTTDYSPIYNTTSLIKLPEKSPVNDSGMFGLFGKNCMALWEV